MTQRMVKKTEHINLLSNELRDVIDKFETCIASLSEKISEQELTMKMNLLRIQRCLDNIKKQFTLNNDEINQDAVRNLLMTFDEIPSRNRLFKRSVAQYYDENVMSPTQTKLEQGQDAFIYTARTILRVFDFIATTISWILEKAAYGSCRDVPFETYNHKYETPFARMITGKSQFFSRPILTINVARDELKRVHRLLDRAMNEVNFPDVSAKPGTGS